MKFIGIILILSAALCSPAQSSSTLPSKSVDGASGNWSTLGPLVQGEYGYSLSQKGIRMNRDGRYELWVKIVPSNNSSFARRYSLPRETRYVLQYATIDCGRRNLLLENTSLYDSNAQPLPGRTTALTPSSRKSMVKPGSIGESIFRYVCVETTSVPLDAKPS